MIRFITMSNLAVYDAGPASMKKRKHPRLKLMTGTLTGKRDTAVASLLTRRAT